MVEGWVIVEHFQGLEKCKKEKKAVHKFRLSTQKAN